MMSPKSCFIPLESNNFIHLREFLYSEKNAITKRENICKYKLADCPESLKKKVTSIKFFRDNLCMDSDVSSEGALTYTPSYIQSQMVYVKKWMKLQNSTMFRLSNKLVQIVFDDRTAIIFDMERKQITYTGYSGERSVYSLATVLESENTDMIKRFKYGKEVIGQLLSTGSRTHKDILNKLSAVKSVYSKTFNENKGVHKLGIMQQGYLKNEY